MRKTIFFLSYIRNTKGYGDSPCDTYPQYLENVEERCRLRKY
jgi:hypothetical protein